MAIVLFSSKLKCIFFSAPASILSLANSKSIASTKFLFFLDASIAASLHKLAISAPENPGLNTANLLAYSLISDLGSIAIGFR
jgi:hypothetical protein